MKKLGKSPFILLLTMCISSTALATEFCDGYKAGYISGYKQARNTSIAPITPICPIKPIKRMGDPSSDYQMGYNTGFIKGRSA